VRRFAFFSSLAILISAKVFAQQVPSIPADAMPGVMQPDLDYWNLKAQQNEELYIPPSMERPLGEDAGPRIIVSNIELDIDAGLDKMISPELRATIRQVVNNRVVENQANGFTIGRLENTAADVTDTLRDNGFILAWAYLPEQSVDNATVSMTVLPGRLSDIVVDGNERYSADRLIDPFGDILGQPVVKNTIEESILRVRNYPGMSTSAVFSPGENVGTSKLTLRVSEDPFDMAFVADNHGTESTGENRLRTDLYLNNPFGRADLLTANILQTFDPAENTYGGINYVTPMFRDDLYFGIGYSQNAFEVAQGAFAGAGVGGTNVEGDTTVVNLSLTKNMRLTRRSRVDLGFDFAAKDSEIKNLPFDSGDKLSVVSMNLGVEAVDNFISGGINQLQLQYAQGLDDFAGSMTSTGDDGRSTRRGGSGNFAGGDFSKFAVRYQRLQRLTRSNSLLMRIESQYSSDLLTSLEQVVMGGPNNVRGYPVATFLVDESMFGSLEWIIELTSLFGEGTGNTSVSLSFFGDYGEGKLNDPLPAEFTDIDIMSYGVGLSITHTGDGGNRFALSIDAAEPDKLWGGLLEDESQLFAQLSYTFR
jgi:hemolysin activation/secretion protein